MYERSLNVAEAILREAKKPWLSVRELWDTVQQQSKEKNFEVPPLPDFTAMLDGDPRFQIIPAREEGEPIPELPPDSEIDVEEMERLGFYPEDRVRLTSVPVPDLVDAEASISEDEEEVGSIRRRAFVDQVSKEKKVIARKKRGPKKVVRKLQKKTKTEKKSTKKPKGKTTSKTQKKSEVKKKTAPKKKKK